MDELEASRFESVSRRRLFLAYPECSYGFEIARLSVAKTEAKQAYDIARRGKVSDTVMHDIQVSRKVFYSNSDSDRPYSPFLMLYRKISPGQNATTISYITMTSQLRQPYPLFLTQLLLK